MDCIQLVVNQGSKMMGLKLLAMHIFNLMLRGSLLVSMWYTYDVYVPSINSLHLWLYCKL